MSQDHLPEPLRKQLEEAERLQKQLNEGSDDADAARIAAEEAAAAEAKRAEEEAERVAAEAAAAAEAKRKEDEAGASPTNDGVYAPPAPAQQDDFKAKWEQAEARYRSLRGKYDSEVPQLRSQIDNLTRQHEQLLKLFEAQAPSAPEGNDKLLAEDKEKFGEDLVDMVDRQAMALLKRVGLSPEALKKLETQLAEVRTVTSGVALEVEKSAEQRMLETLHAVLPEYGQIDQDPRFGAWLQKPDPISGIQRAVLYQKAGMEDFDATRVERIMRQFVDELGVRLKSDIDKGVAVVQPTVDPRAAHAAPPRGAGAPAAPAAAQKKVWGKAEISEFYKKSMRGGYTPAEAKRIEAEIFEAQREGRII